MVKRTRAAIFTRVSTADQHNLNQRHVLEQMAEQRGLQVAKVYEETISGTSKNRPELDRMLRDAHAGRFSCLLIWALDRLGRTMVGNLQVVLDLDAKGIKIVSAQEGWLDLEGPVRSLLVAVFSWCAGQENHRCSCGALSIRSLPIRSVLRMRQAPIDVLKTSASNRS